LTRPPATSPRTRTVAVILHDRLLNGAAIAVLRTIAPLESRGWRFAFWVPGEGPAMGYLRERGYPVQGIERPLASGLRALREPPGVARRISATPAYLRALSGFLRELAPDLVHSNSLYSFGEALTARSLGLPTVLHLHDMAPTSWKAGIARLICRRGVNACFAVSDACARTYAQAGWTPTVVHGAGPVPAEAVRIRTDPRPFVVGTVGVISRRKGSDVFVEAAERLRASGRFAFEMVGAPDDPLDREWGGRVLSRARVAGIEHLASADVEARMRGWDAFVLPSRRDPFPLAMLEAMGLGLPAIGARVDGIPEQLAPGTGLLVAPGDPAALAAAIEHLAAVDPAEREAMGALARARVAAEFSLDRLVEGTDRVYRATLAE
jgi:glycosyltransferase involved in cell wall biosynthesis